MEAWTVTTVTEEEEQKGGGERKQKLRYPELTINFPKN